MRQVLQLVVESEPDLSVVGTARDAESAIAAVPVVSPDIVLMDVQLPGINGIEATHELSSLHPLVRVVVLSASCSHALVSGALAVGAWGYLLKEGSPEDLLAGIRAVVDGRRTLAAGARAVLEA